MQDYVFNTSITDGNENMLLREKQLKITAILQILFDFISD